MNNAELVKFANKLRIWLRLPALMPFSTGKRNKLNNNVDEDGHPEIKALIRWCR